MLIVAQVIGPHLLIVGENKMTNLEKKMERDSYQEHEAFHQSFHPDCSTCFSENLRLKESNRDYVNRMREELGLPNYYERTRFDDPRSRENPLE